MFRSTTISRISCAKPCAVDDSVVVSPLYKFWLVIRSTFFWAFFLPFILLCATLLSLSFFMPLWFRIGIIKIWIACSLASLHLFCGLKFSVEGEENIPEKGFIVMSKHSSTWETIAIQKFFRPMVWVVKRELTWIPFFGWALKAMNAIALNRGTGRKAITQLIKESQVCLQRFGVTRSRSAAQFVEVEGQAVLDDDA